MTGQRPQVVAVTGAARGIGAAVAARFAADPGFAVRGYDVIERISNPGDRTPAYELERCDVSDEAAVKACAERIEREHGTVDVLVNVAGVVLVRPVDEIAHEEFLRTMSVNVGGTWLWCKHVIPMMKRQHSGVIVNVASVSGHVGQVAHALYGASKGAILSFTRALAWELAPHNIRVVSVSPGSVDTEMLRADVRGEAERLRLPFDQLRTAREGEQALGRWAEPEEIAEPIFFLASRGASFITGADLLVDGGWTAR